ncbi:Major cardiolipin synthase ClsA [Usitatibacter palustris]|uniref:Cardiolipin synthase n=2 Tax=Usitatibacter palustris TaxID=2732487 RepID=A0A6M4HE07_9PROT|nr:Major cardiolipin synthase ClsA [Usitatibacter palustris]
MPPIEREMLASRNEPVKLDGARGTLTAAQSKAILDNMKARSPETAIFDRHLAVEEAIAGSPLSVGNKVTLLQDGPATYRAMFEQIAKARDSVHLEMYIVEDDEIGEKFAEALLAAKKRGAQVNLMYDSVGSINTPPEFFKRLADGGIEVHEFNPVNPMKAKKGWELNERNHRKLLIVDGKVAFLGGINISGVYSAGSATLRRSNSGPQSNGRSWRDTQLQIEGPAVTELQKTFVEAWMKSAKEPPPLKNAYPQLKPEGKEVVRTLAGWGDHEVNPIYVTLISAVKSADKSVHITMAYFVPDPVLLAALKEATARGVDVTIILPSFTDFWAVFHAGRSHYTDLLEAGVKIYERRERLLHSKTAVIDGVWSTVGSANFDWRSFTHNHELNAVVLSPEFGAQMEAMFQKDITNSDLITLEDWKRRPFENRMREAAARIWEYWL